MARMTANNTKISYKSGSEAATFTELEYLMEVPEFGGAPEKIDVTTLSDKVKKYVPGTKDLGDLVFKFLYDNSSDTSNYRVLKGQEDAGTAVTYKIEYPDGTAHQFDAIPSVKMDAGTLNGALTFSATMMLQSDITVTNPTA
ncbi:MAG: phage tail tube protein [Acutalibacteraceae bacterium]